MRIKKKLIQLIFMKLEPQIRNYIAGLLMKENVYQNKKFYKNFIKKITISRENTDFR